VAQGAAVYAYTFGTKEHPRHPLNLVPALLLYLIFMILQVWYESPAWPLFAYTVFPTLIGIYARKLYVSLTARRRARKRHERRVLEERARRAAAFPRGPARHEIWKGDLSVASPWNEFPPY